MAKLAIALVAAALLMAVPCFGLTRFYDEMLNKAQVCGPELGCGCHHLAAAAAAASLPLPQFATGAPSTAGRPSGGFRGVCPGAQQALLGRRSRVWPPPRRFRGALALLLVPARATCMHGGPIASKSSLYIVKTQ